MITKILPPITTADQIARMSLHQHLISHLQQAIAAYVAHHDAAQGVS